MLIQMATSLSASLLPENHTAASRPSGVSARLTECENGATAGRLSSPAGASTDIAWLTGGAKNSAGPGAGARQNAATTAAQNSMERKRASFIEIRLASPGAAEAGTKPRAASQCKRQVGCKRQGSARHACA